jgi:uncharacterized membrane protein
VHGGGFYNPQKYMVAPKSLPAHLHWFYWESYSTWLTGFALFTVLYLWQASTFLIDQRVHAWPPAAAIGAALAFLAVFWLVYDGICRAFGRRVHGDRIVGAAVAVVVVLGAWLACQLFAGRAAFLLVGAMMATAMSANVFFWIIPGQRTVIAQMRAGEPVDPVHGQRAKQRSVHNTYFTLPVLAAMLSNHYGFLYGAEHNWAVLVIVMGAGALIRHAFVVRHKALVQGKRVPWEFAVAGTVLLLGVAVWLAPASKPAARSVTAVTFAQAQQVVGTRCVMCHNEQLASKGVRLDSAEGIAAHAQQLYQQAVVLKLMPLNNATGITDDERALLKRWFEAGASTSP